MGKIIKLLYISILIFLPKQILFCQNIVPNPSFECGETNCEATVQTVYFPQYACDWSCPTTGTSDIFSIDEANPYCYSSMPYHNSLQRYHIGSQLPRTGKRFAGIYSYSGDQPRPHQYREYLEVELNEPLVAGEYYCAEMYASPGENAFFVSNNLGMAFVETKVEFYDDYHELPLTPQIVESQIISDTVNWVKIGAIFKAGGQEKYLIIGNFSNDKETSAIPYFQNSTDYNAYYFIDDVSVERLPHSKFSFLGNTNICEGDSVLIEASVGTTNIVWTTLVDKSTVISNGPTLKVKPDTSTSYYVRATGCNMVVEDTVFIMVKPLPSVNLGRDTTICENTSIILDAGSGHSSNVWQDNSISQYYDVKHAGNYSVTVKNDFGCKNYDKINISFKPLPKVDLGRNALMCKDIFSIAVNGGDVSYLWSTGSKDSVIYPVNSGTYWVTLQNRCGSATDSIHIYSIADLFIPNVLTLNRDSLNEVFGFRGIGEQDVKCRLRIVNRWGKEVYRNEDYKQDWPPVNDELPQGTYYYMIVFENCSEYKGWIHVLK